MVVLLLINFALCAYVFLITWRIARRFGWRGLVIVGLIVVGHGVLRLLAGPARKDPLARRPWAAVNKSL